MRIGIVIGIVLAAVVTLPSIAFGQQQPAGKIELKILYAGHPATAREKEFVQFLAQHFSEVKTADFAKFTDADAKGFDVVLLDYDGDGFKAPCPRLAPNYTRPTMTLGVAGALMSGSLGLKTGYM